MIVSDIELMRLRDCSLSTRMGMSDKGFPLTFMRLEGLQLVQAKDDGYILTTYGQEYLKTPEIMARMKKL